MKKIKKIIAILSLAMMLGITTIPNYACTGNFRTTLYGVNVTALNFSLLRFMHMNLSFFLSVNDHRLVIHFFYLQCSHLLSVSLKKVKK